MKVLGIKSTKMTSGKNEGKMGITYFFEKDFSDYDMSTSKCEGSTICQEFSYTDFGVKVGDIVNPVYEKGYQDRAILVNLIPVPFKDAK